MLDLEAGVEGVLHILPNESAEQIRSHAGVQILTDLERDLDFFREGRRDVLGYLILRCIETSVSRKLSDIGRRTILDLNACSRHRFAEYSFCKSCRGGDCDRSGLGIDTQRQAAGECNRD